MKTELTAAECIAALRHCTDDGTELCVDDQYRCPLWNEDRMTDCCKADLMLAAVDLIEAQQKQITELERDWEKAATLVTEYEAKNIELERQLPKEGEWIDDNGANVPLDRDGYTTGMCRCSVCNDWLIASDEYEVRGRYCPNCGARMKGEQE